MGSLRFVILLIAVPVAVFVGEGWDLTVPKAYAINVKLSMEEANQAMAEGRESMEKAEKVEEVATIMKAAERSIRVGADPEKDPCGTHAILRTRRYWLEYFGRREAAESKRQKKAVRMPDSKVQEILEMPYLEVEVRLCGDEEFFAEGADVALQQGTGIPFDRSMSVRRNADEKIPAPELVIDLVSPPDLLMLTSILKPRKQARCFFSRWQIDQY